MQSRFRVAAAAAVVLSAILISAWLSHRPSPSPQATLARLPVHFEPTAASGSYAARGPGFSLLLDEQGATVHLAQTTLELQLLGAHPSTAQPEGALGGVSNYFLGNDSANWRTQVPHFSRVRYAGVYSGIDLIYYGAGHELEYDFVVAPGVDPSQIQLSYAGARDVQIDKAGNLRVQVEGGEVVHRKPVSYQVVDGTRRAVKSAFRMIGRSIASFDVGNYDTRLPLVIDPVLTYATYLGGSGGNEEISAMAVDAVGAVYVGGLTNSADLPVTAGAFQATPADNTDVYIAKLNPQGTALEYATYLGGNSLEEVQVIRIDASGNAYIAGDTSSTDFPVTAGAAQETHGGAHDVFVTKLNPQGTALVYSTYLGGSGGEPSSARLGGFELASNGELYIYGDTDSSDFPTTLGAPQTTRGNPNPLQFDEDVFLTRLNAAGTAFVFSTYHGGSAIDALSEDNPDSTMLAIDDSGSAWFVGTSESADFPTTAGAFDTTFAGPSGGNPGGGDIFVARYDTTAGTRTYSTFLGGSADEFATGIAVDTAGNAYVTGSSASANYPATAGAFDTTHNGSSDVVVTKIDPTGAALVYSTFLGQGLPEAPTAIRIDAAGTAFVAGSTQSDLFPVTPGAADTSFNGGGNDGFITHLDASGATLLYSTFAGSSDSDGVMLMEIDAAGSAYALLGDFVGDALVTPGGLPYSDNGDDYFVKLSSDGTSFLDASYIGGEEGDVSLVIAVDAQQNLYLAGVTESVNYPTTAGVLQPAKVGIAGQEDSFIAKFATTPNSPSSQPGTLALTAATFTVGEATGTASITVSRTGGATGAVGVTCTTSTAGGNTATAGTDYTATTATLNWADGDSAAKTCSVPIADDAADESDETFTVTLSNATGGAALGTPSSAVVTITDDDSPAAQPGTVQFSAGTYSGNENGGSVTLTLTRPTGADGAISVSVTSGGGSAAAGADYTPVTQTVNWPDGDTAAKTVALVILDDSTDELNETITVTLSNATGGASLGTATATVTILDDDPTPPAGPSQSANASGSYGGGAMDWRSLVALGLCALIARLMRGRRLRLLPLLACASVTAAQAGDQPEGWYLGIRGGVAESTLDEGDIQSALTAAGHNVTVDSDDQQPNIALFGGYRWASGLGFEASIVDLGEYDVAITGTTTNPGALPTDVEATLADAGRGISAALSWSWMLGSRWELTPRVGAYYWESDRELRGDFGRIRRDQSGLDLVAGISLTCRLTQDWSLGIGWDSWDAGGRNDIRAVTAALAYRF